MYDPDPEDDDLHAARRANRAAMSQRWIPYKQTNGVAIYYHQQNDDSTGVGGEYMVSAVVRGRPNDVLDVLMHGSANTTILGPARKVEVLECSKPDNNTTKEVGAQRLSVESAATVDSACSHGSCSSFQSLTQYRHVL